MYLIKRIRERNSKTGSYKIESYWTGICFGRKEYGLKLPSEVDCLDEIEEIRKYNLPFSEDSLYWLIQGDKLEMVHESAN